MLHKVEHYGTKIPLNEIQVSLAIRGGYVPDKFQTENIKTDSLGSKLG